MLLNFNNINVIIDVIKMIFISICTYITFLKISNDKKTISKEKFLGYILLFVFSFILIIVKYKTSFSISILFTTFSLSCICYKTTGNDIGNSIITTIISLAINYIILFISAIFIFIVNKIIKIENDLLNLCLILITYIIILIKTFNIKKLKYGMIFIQNSNEYIDIIILSISLIILFSTVILVNSNMKFATDTTASLLIFSSIMFITIQKSIQLYYKQKLLVQELKETKDKLEEKTKEIKELEEENIKISKKSHTLVHKQKSLEHKIDGLIGKTEISKEEVGELTNRIKEINKELYKQKIAIELDKTEIQQIDDMLKYMQSECKKNNIDFELQIKGSIHHMTNNLISKEDLETLLADHIKNAIIAINHGNNINRSILVRIGKIDECYGLYIYDSGLDFEKETLQNLGKKPSTTHANEGGTGMGFMNTFDTLRKCNASLIIEEYNEPSKDNYTKVIKIKFNNKNEFEIKTYREKSTI